MSDFIASLQDTLEYMVVLMPSLLTGAWCSLKLFVVTLVLSLPLGLPFALGSNSRIADFPGTCKTIYLDIQRHSSTVAAVLLLLFSPHCF